MGQRQVRPIPTATVKRGRLASLSQLVGKRPSERILAAAALRDTGANRQDNFRKRWRAPVADEY